MGHTLLCVLALFLLSTLLYGQDEGQNEEQDRHTEGPDVKEGLTGATVSYNGLPQYSNNSGDAVLESPAFTVFEGDSVTMRCKQHNPSNDMDAAFFKKGSRVENHQSRVAKMTIHSVSKSDEGTYTCKFGDRAESEAKELRVRARRRRVSLRADETTIPVRGRVTLTCDVEGATDLENLWIRYTSDSSKTPVDIENGYQYDISHGGSYTCQGLRREPDFFTSQSNAVIIQETVSSKATVTLQPNWPQIFSGEKMTLRCEIQGGGDTGWTYEWSTTSPNKPPAQKEYTIDSATEYHRGQYNCRGRRDSYSSTQWSDFIALEVLSYRPRAGLSADNEDIPVGSSVTLTCSVSPSSSSSSSSSGWKYFWYRGEKTSEPLTTQDVSLSSGQILVSQGGLYWCRGGRGDPVYYTEYSDPIYINKILSNKATVTLQPNWLQIFSGEKMTLRCEIQGGGDTGWTYDWSTTSGYTPPAGKDYIISSAAWYHRGQYRCVGRRDYYSSTQWSDVITLTVLSYTPRARLSADNEDIPVGGSVTLTCSVNPSSSSGWTYFWYRGAEPLTSQDYVFLSDGKISVSQGGLYWCRGGRGDPVYYTGYSGSVRVNKIITNRPVVTLHPDWPEIYFGETITLTCEIKNRGDNEWEYEWKHRSNTLRKQREYMIGYAATSDSGDYKCRGRVKGETSSTEWSDAFTLRVSSNKLQPVLTVSPLWLSPGASVTLNCSVKHPSAGWRFFWYKAVPKLSDNSYSYELIPGSIHGTEQDSYIVDGQTHTAGYVCRAGRGDPVYYTNNSKPKFVWSGDVHSSASLTVSPDRVQHFTTDSVSLNCDGNSTEWRVKKLTESGSILFCQNWGTMTGSTCSIKRYQPSNAVYWCESGSGEFSNAVNITISNRDVILVSPVHPVTEGDSVSLSCRIRSQTFASKVFFYRNDKLIQNDTRRELNISAVSKYDEGFYKCKYSTGVSAQSWMSVKGASRPESSSFPIPMIIRLVFGIVVVILLPLLYCFTPSKDSCFIRPVQSESTNRGSAACHMVNQNEAQQNEDPSPLHGDARLYESIKGSDDTDNDTSESQDATYSLIELKNTGKKGKRHEPEESCLYSDVKIGTAEKSTASTIDETSL